MLNLPTNSEIDKLEIEKMARDDASMGVPHEDDDTLSESEITIENFVYDEIDKMGTSVETQLLDDHEFRVKVNFDQELDKLKYADTHLSADIVKTEKKNIQPLVNSQLSVIEKQTDFNLFRNENKLNKLPLYPKSRTDYFMMIAFIVVVESILNATFLSKGSELGYIGGAVIAFLISLGNLLLAWMLIEFGVKNLFHIKSYKKVIGALIIPIISFVIISYVFLVGHYRDELSISEQEGTTPFEASINAVKAMYANPTAISDFFAWVLIVISLLAVCIMGYKIFFGDDEYPGYGKRHRKLIEAEKDFQKSETMHQEEILNLIRKEKVELITSKQNCTEKFHSYKNSIDKSNEILTQYEKYISRIINKYEDLLMQYRKVNKQIKYGNPPKYFDDEISVDKSRIKIINTSLLDMDVINVKSLEDAMEQIPSAYKESGSKLDSVEKDFEKNISDFSSEIRAAANNKHAINAVV